MPQSNTGVNKSIANDWINWGIKEIANIINKRLKFRKIKERNINIGILIYYTARHREDENYHLASFFLNKQS